MKLIYKKQKWKKYSERRAKRLLIQTRKDKKAYNKRHKRCNAKSQKISYDKIKKRNKRVELEAPENFSLINNIDETLSFFEAINHFIEKGKPVFLDISNIKTISCDAILYTLSRLDYNYKSHNGAKISGNVPKDNKCREILQKSGFLDFVNSKQTTIKNDPNIYSVQSGNHVIGEKAKDVRKFTEKKLKIKDDDKIIYPILIECMANTKNHAYKNDSLHDSWWLMASYDDEKKCVRFTFLDNGLGIPYTVRKKFGEQIREKISNLSGISALNDFMLIESALKGELRTRTKKRYRGKGLPKIKSTSDQSLIDDLTIISRKGFYNSNSKSSKQLNNIFYGTLLSWDFV